MWIIHDLSCSNGWAWAFACSLHLSLSLLFSLLILRTDFHQTCSMFNMTGFHGHHMQWLQRGDWFSLMGSDSESRPLEHSYSTYQMQDRDRGRWKCLPYCRCLPTLSLSLFCVFLLQDVLMSDEVRMVRESWKISKIGLFYHVNLPFLWQSVGRLWFLWYSRDKCKVDWKSKREKQKGRP